MLRTLLMIGAGSFAGGILRYLVSRGMNRWLDSSLPWSTLTVNILGCLVLGALCALFEKGAVMDRDMQAALTVGLCGGFTTFSTFMHENYRLLLDGNILAGIGYPALSLALGLAAVYCGYQIARII